MKNTEASRLIIETTAYEWSHGTKPRGRGGWAFYPEGDESKILWVPFSGTLTAAKKWLKDTGNTGEWQVAP